MVVKSMMRLLGVFSVVGCISVTLINAQADELPVKNVEIVETIAKSESEQLSEICLDEENVLEASVVYEELCSSIKTVLNKELDSANEESDLSKFIGLDSFSDSDLYGVNSFSSNRDATSFSTTKNGNSGLLVSNADSSWLRAVCSNPVAVLADAVCSYSRTSVPAGNRNDNVIFLNNVVDFFSSANFNDKVVDASDIAANTISLGDISTSSMITSSAIAPNAITIDKIDPDVVAFYEDDHSDHTIRTNEVFSDGSVTGRAIQDGIITAANIDFVAELFGSQHIADRSIQSSSISFEVFSNPDLTNSDVTVVSEILDSGFAVNRALTGSSGIYTSSSYFVTAAVTSSKLADSSVTGTTLADATLTVAHFAPGVLSKIDLADEDVITNIHIQTGAVTTAALANGAVTGDDIADGALTSDLFPSDAASLEHLYATGAFVSRHIVAVSIEDFADGAITGAQISESSVSTGAFSSNLQASGLPSASIAPNTVHSYHLQSGTVTSAKIIDGAITGSKVAAGQISPEHLIVPLSLADYFEEDSITSVQISDGSISSTEVVDGSIFARHVASSTLTASHFADSAIEARHLSTGVVAMSQSVVTADLGYFTSLEEGNREYLTGKLSEIYSCAPGTESWCSSILSLDTSDLASTTVTQQVSGIAGLRLESIGTADLADSIVSSDQLAVMALSSINIAFGSITLDHLSDALKTRIGAISGGVAPGVVSGVHIQADSVRSEHIVDQSVEEADLSDSVQTAFDAAATLYQSAASAVSKVQAALAADSATSSIEVSVEDRVRVENAVAAFQAGNLAGVSTLVVASTPIVRNFVTGNLNAGAFAMQELGSRSDTATAQNFSSASVFGRFNYLRTAFDSQSEALATLQTEYQTANADVDKLLSAVAMAGSLNSMYVERGRKGSLSLALTNYADKYAYGVGFGSRFNNTVVMNVAVSADANLKYILGRVDFSFSW